MRFALKKRIIRLQVPPYKKRFMKSITFLGVFCLIIVISFYFFDFRVRPTLSRLAEAKVRQIAATNINEAIKANISPNIEYQSLIKVQFDKDGKISFIQPNTGEINRISSEATLAVQKRLLKIPQIFLKIPVGQIFGSRILAGMGPEVPVKIFPVGYVESTINDCFDVAGINQTRHRIYVTIKAIVKTVIPLVNQEVQVSTNIPLAEAIIVGDVPNVYVNGGGVILPSSGK